MRSSKTGSRELPRNTFRLGDLIFLPPERKFDAGRDKGSKDRPCAIILTVLDDDGELTVAPWLRARPPPHRRDRLGVTENGVEISGSVATKERARRMGAETPRGRVAAPADRL